MSSQSELESMLRKFRVHDLQELLAFAGKQRIGKKNYLLDRALELVKFRVPGVDVKIHEIYSYLHSGGKRRTESFMSQPPPSSSSSSSSHSYPRRTHTYHSSRDMPNRQVPVTPGVRLAPLSFFEVLDELMRPTSVLASPTDTSFPKRFLFHLTPQHVSRLLSEPAIKVQVRFCPLDASCLQMDEVPPTAKLYINRREVVLPKLIPTNKPGATAQRQKLPVDVTPAVNKTPLHGNEILVSYDQPMPSKLYCVSAYLVRQMQSQELFDRLLAKGWRNPDITTGMIREKLRDDLANDIEVNLTASLICPISKVRMTNPCRASRCPHIQCFDAMAYLSMNERSAKWSCGVCHAPALYDDLAVDGLFHDIVRRAPPKCTQVTFALDGSWTPILPDIKPRKEPELLLEMPTKVKKTEAFDETVEIICLDDSSDEDDVPPPPLAKKTLAPPSSPITIDDSRETTRDSIDADDQILVIDEDTPSFLEPTKLPYDNTSQNTILPDIVPAYDYSSSHVPSSFGSEMSAFSKPTSNQDTEFSGGTNSTSSTYTYVPNYENEYTVTTSEDEDVVAIDD